MARSTDASNTLGYCESLINYANDLRTTTVYPSLPSPPALPSFRPVRRARTRNLDVLPLCPSILSSERCRPSSQRLFLPLPVSVASPLHRPTASTQLARLFIKTSKLTGFNRVRFTLFAPRYIIYYGGRPVPATSLRPT